MTTKEDSAATNDIFSLYGLPSNQKQWVAIIWLMRISSILSIIGSSTILYMILSDRKWKLERIHNRLLTGMSSIDILNSIALGCSTALSPRGTPYAYGALGTNKSCTVQGFFLQVGLGVPTYNAMLCIYYLLSVKYNVSESRISNRYERLMHATAILYPLITAIAGASFGVFNSTGLLCWFSALPMNCRTNDEVDCIRGHHVMMCSIFFAAIEVIAIFIVIIFSMASLIISIRQVECKMSRYNFNGSSSSSSASKKCSKSRESTNQALLYVGAFAVSHLPNVVVGILRASKLNVPFFMTIILALCFPLQGLLNFLVYFIPRYRIVKLNLGDSKSVLFILKVTLFEPEALRPTKTKRRSMNGLIFKKT